MYKNIAIFILVAIIIFSVKQCSDIDDNAKQERENNSAKEYTLNTRLDKQDKLITEQKQVIVNTKKERDELIVKVEGLTNITEQVRVITKTKIDSIKILIDRPIYLTIDTGKAKGTYLAVPTKFNKINDEWYGLTGNIGLKGSLEVDSLWFNNKITISFGMEKWNIKKPFKNRVPLVSFQDENPYSKVKSMKNVKYDKPLPKISIGLQGGYGVTTKGLGGYVGIGINYSIISF